MWPKDRLKGLVGKENRDAPNPARRCIGIRQDHLPLMVCRRRSESHWARLRPSRGLRYKNLITLSFLAIGGASNGPVLAADFVAEMSQEDQKRRRPV